MPASVAAILARVFLATEGGVAPEGPPQLLELRHRETAVLGEHRTARVAELAVRSWHGRLLGVLPSSLVPMCRRFVQRPVPRMSRRCGRCKSAIASDRAARDRGIDWNNERLVRGGGDDHGRGPLVDACRSG